MRSLPCQGVIRGGSLHPLSTPGGCNLNVCNCAIVQFDVQVNKYSIFNIFQGLLPANVWFFLADGKLLHLSNFSIAVLAFHYKVANYFQLKSESSLLF